MKGMKLAGLVSVPVLAVLLAGNAQPGLDPQEAMCFVPGPGIEAKDRSLSVVASPARAAQLESEGFLRRHCAMGLADLAEYQDGLCEYARAVPASERLNFASDFGIDPLRMCELAEEIQI